MWRLLWGFLIRCWLSSMVSIASGGLYFCCWLLLIFNFRMGTWKSTFFSTTSRITFFRCGSRCWIWKTSYKKKYLVQSDFFPPYLAGLFYIFMKKKIGENIPPYLKNGGIFLCYKSLPNVRGKFLLDKTAKVPHPLLFMGRNDKYRPHVFKGRTQIPPAVFMEGIWLI